MKLIDRSREFLAYAIKKKPAIRVAKGMLSMLDEAHAFIIGERVLGVGQQAIGKLPWNLPFGSTWFEWNLDDDRNEDDKGESQLVADKYSQAFPNGPKIRFGGSAAGGLVIGGFEERLDPGIAVGKVSAASGLFRFTWSPLIPSPCVMISPTIAIIFKDEETGDCSHKLAISPLHESPGGDPFWRSEFDTSEQAAVASETSREAARYLAWQIVGAMCALSCRNIVGEQYTPTPAESKARTRSGGLAPVSYRILKVEIPRSVSGSSGDLDLTNPADPKRLHVVRGHFKNLKDPKFKNPGWHWWPAHLRGSIDKGVVVKDYRIEKSDE